jgi:ribonuclease PH
MSKIILPNFIVQKDIKKNCSASVYLESENIKILCYLNGPFFSSNNQINNNFNVILTTKIKIPSYIENSLIKFTNDYEITLENILKKHILIEKYPRTKLEIFFEIFEFNINFLPFCLMAASLCLNYAGVEQKGLITSCNLLINNNNNNITINPILNDNNKIDDNDNKNYANFLLGYNIALNENILYIQEGECSEENLKKSLATSIKICEIYQNYLITKM